MTSYKIRHASWIPSLNIFHAAGINRSHTSLDTGFMCADFLHLWLPKGNWICEIQFWVTLKIVNLFLFGGQQA